MEEKRVEEEKQEEFLAETAEIHYFYTFSFSPIPFNSPIIELDSAIESLSKRLNLNEKEKQEIQNVTNNNILRFEKLKDFVKKKDKEKEFKQFLTGLSIPLGEFIQRKLDTSYSGEYSTGEKLHWAEEMEPPQYRADLYVKFPHLSLSVGPEIKSDFSGEVKVSEINEQMEYKNKFGAVLSSHMALFEPGMGVISLKLRTEEKLTVSELIKLINSSLFFDQKFSSYPTYCLNKNNTHTTFFAIFEKAIYRLLHILNEIVGQPTPNVFTIASDLSLQKIGEIRWFETDREFNLLHPEPLGIKDLNSIKHFHDPFIVTVLKVSDNTYEFILKDINQPTAKYSLQLKALLLRNPNWKFLDPINPVVSEKLYNLFCDSRVFIQIYTGSTVLLHAEGFRDRKEQESIMMGLFRTVVSLRGRWHSYLIANARLGSEVTKLFLQFQSLFRGGKLKQGSERELIDKQSEIIEMKSDFLRSLSVDDPLIYGIGGSPFSKVYEKGLQIYKIDELQKIVWNRIRELDALFNMITAFRRTKSLYEEIKPPELKPVKKWFKQLIPSFIGLAWAIIFYLFMSFLLKDLGSRYPIQPWFSTVLRFLPPLLPLIIGIIWTIHFRKFD